MAIHAERNLYPGVNAHLNNLLQTSGRQRWRSFHHSYIEFLRIALDRILPVGYVAAAEDSLQITVDPEDALAGLVIYQSGEGDPPGRPITRIEMLSPSNKPGGSHHQVYFVKRALTLKSGIRVVEIDLLHLSPPVDAALPSYLDRRERTT